MAPGANPLRGDARTWQTERADRLGFCCLRTAAETRVRASAGEVARDLPVGGTSRTEGSSLLLLVLRAPLISDATKTRIKE